VYCGYGRRIAGQSPHCRAQFRSTPIAKASPVALIIAPTRELALQVSRELEWLYGPTGARVATCVGGMDPSKERRAFRKARISWSARRAACAITSNAARLTCSGLSCAVLDEADEMLDMGFREDLEEMLDATPGAGARCCFRRPCPSPSSRWPSATSAMRCAFPPWARIAAMATSPIRPSPSLRPISKTRGQPAALPRSGNRDPVLRHARQCAPPPRQPDRARLCRRRAFGRA
jgi:hypothetical protein